MLARRVRPSQPKRLLRRSRLSGLPRGWYTNARRTGDLVERLRSQVIKEDIHREVGVQTVGGLFGVLFGVFLALISGEWLLRKFYQLN